MNAERLALLLERVRKREITPEQAVAVVRDSERAGKQRENDELSKGDNGGPVQLAPALGAPGPGVTPDRSRAAPPHPPIAVIGMSGRFAGAPDLEAYWRNLSEGVISVGEVPADRWRADDHYDPRPSVAGKSNSKWGGFLDGIDLFDPLFFSVSPREAELMDPQQRLFLTEAWRALENAGYGGVALDKQACGVFVGCGVGDYLQNLREHGVSPDALAFLGNSNPILAARISFLLNLRGPSLAVDTACSSSLVAVQLACESIASGTSTMALAGGVSIFTTPLTHLLAGQAGMLSPHGRCFTFDERADGFVPAEGVGVVVLKRLDQAQRDGDQVHGIIVGSGINQDGRSNGITAPSATSQTALLRDIYARFGIDPESISLVEAHGTGTRLGDPIEVSALTDAFASPRTGFCPLGSVKANIGHASTAAGIAGLLKVLLCLKHRRHVPLAGFQRLNPHIDLAGSPFRLVAEAEEWEAPPNGRRLAAVSSFGFSGTNAHLVVAEAPAPRSVSSHAAADRTASRGEDDRHLFVISARDDDALRSRCRDLSDWLRVHPEASARDVSFTLLLGRCHFRQRFALVATREELIGALDRRGGGDAAGVADGSGEVPPPEETLDRTQLTQRGRASLSRLRRAGSGSTDAHADLAVLAACYRKDVALDWSELFPGQPARLPLPSYPFQQRRYWIPVELQGAPASPACPGHPLLDRIDLENSIAAGLVFEKTIPPDLPLVDEHRVLGEKVLPGMAFLEMALAAGRTVFPGRTWRITDVVWSAPLIIGDEPRGLRLTLTRQDQGYGFHFESDSGRHCQGVLQPAAAESGVRHSPEALVALCPEVQPGARLYAFFEQRGLRYGPSFRGVEEVRSGVDQLVARLRLPRGAHPGQGLYWMNPAMADAALQAAACLFVGPGQEPEGLLLPFALADAHVLRPLPETGFACARVTGERCLELVILDDNGEACARFKGLALRPLGTGRLVAPAPDRRSSGLPVDAPMDHELSGFMGAFSRLESWAVARLWQVMEPRLPAAIFTRDELPQHVVMAPRFRRLGPGLLDLLVSGGWLESRGGDALVRTGKPSLDGAALEGERRRIIERSSWIAPFARLVEDCTRNLFEILAGTLDVTRVLFPTGRAEDVAGIHGGNPLADRFNQTMAALAAEVAATKAKLGPVRVLEIGGGTGATSRFVLEALAPLAGRVAYVFTDISPAFVRAAAVDLARPFATFQAFDLERDPGAQGLPADFDLILAANVVHATEDIAASLGRLRKLLRPGGVILISEMTAATAFGTLTFGLTDGWWRFRDEARRLPGAPLLAPDAWVEALREAGFHDMAAYGEALCAQGSPIDHRLFKAIGGGDVDTVLVARSPGASSDGDRAYVSRVLASVLKVPESEIVADRYLEEYGVDSLVTQQVVSAFEPDLGKLPATLVFEHPTAAKIAAYLREHCGAALDAVHARRGRTVSIFEAEVRATSPAAPTRHQAAPAELPGAHVAERPGAGPLDVAVVGIAGRYPLAPDLEAFWRNLVEARDCITEVPPERWDWRLYHDPDPDATGRSYTARAGFIDDVDAFDARFFRISPREAEGMDPQERLFLETAWHTVESAGYDPLRLGETGRVGVFVGVMNANYSQLGSEIWRVGERVRGKAAYWSIANRISFCLDYRGPSMAVDTACSSSLTAVHLACQSLVRGECELALAGGVNLILHPSHLVCLSDMHMLSPTGQCRAFGEGADGFVDGEGVGAVLLKPLAQAHADGDSILAVIKGSALNCGGRTTGFTVPSPEAQARVVADALAQSEVPAEAIGYVEAHGTGTALGDPIEIAGLRRAFGVKPAAIALGSVKSQVGHLESAAGIAGLTKLILQLEHRRLPPSLHAETPNPRLELGPFHLLQHDTAWPRPEVETADGPRTYPRSAAISSFGAGGANAHLVMQEGPEPAGRRAPAPGPFLLPFSARTPERLAELLRRHSAFLQSHPATEHFMSDMAFTLQTGRTPMATRIAFVADDPDSLRAVIDAHLSGVGPAGQVFTANEHEDSSVPREGEAGPAAVSRALAEREWNALARLWVAGARVDFAPLWTGGGKRIALPTYPFERTRHWLPVPRPSGIAPPTSKSLLGALSPAASLGAGLVFAVDLSSDSPLVRDHRVDGVPVVPGVATLLLAQAAWSELQPAQPCCLAGVQWLTPLTLEETRELVFRVREIGTTLHFELADGETIYAQGHFESGSPTTPGEPTPDPAALRARFGAWQDAGSIYGDLREIGIEHGPFFQVLSRFASLDDEALAALSLTESARRLSVPWHPALLDGALQTIGAVRDLARAPMLPFGIGRVRFLQPPGGECLCHVARTGPDSFDVTLFGADDGQPLLRLEDVTVRPRGDPLKDLFFTPRWRRLEVEVDAASASRSAVIVFDRASAVLAGGVEARLAASETLRITTDGSGDARTLALSDAARWQERMALFQDPCQVYFLAGPEDPADGDRGVLKLFRFLRALTRAGWQDRPLRLSILTAMACAVFEEDAVSPFPAALHGLALSAARELPRWLVTITDGDDDDAVETILRNQVPVSRSIVAERRGKRYTRDLVPLRLPAGPSPYRRNGVYLIVGGGGGIGMALAADLVRRFDATLFLLGRAELDSERRRRLRDLDPGGTRVHYLRADVTDRLAVQTAIEAAERRAGPINGVFHAALVLRDRGLRAMDEQTFLEALAPKLEGSVVLDACLADRPLDFMAFFSSAQSFLGNAGQANYAAGCTFIDAWAHSLARLRPYPVRVLNWGFWGEVGAVATLAYRERLTAAGIEPLSTRQGLAATERALGSPSVQVVPFKAQASFMESMGVDAAGAMTARPIGYPSVVPAVASTLERPVDATRLDKVREGLNELDRAAARLFHAALFEAGIVVPGLILPAEGAPALAAGRHERLLHAALAILIQEGLVSRSDTGLQFEPPGARPDRAELDRRFPELAAYTDLLFACAARYAVILGGTMPATDALFPEGSSRLAAGIYRGHALADGLNALAAAAVTAFVARCPADRIHILEVGGGTAGTTEALLPALAPLAGRVTYVFSDLSHAFVKEARLRFATHHSFTRFETLDISAPAASVHRPASYDVVIAANVLHATPDLRRTLGHVASLLRPNGMLVLNEVTAPSTFATLTFGLLDGWWSYEDGLRMPDGPLVGCDGWAALLRESGFGAVSVHGFADIHQNVILAEAGVLAPHGEVEARETEAIAPPPASAVRASPAVGEPSALLRRIEASIVTAVSQTLEVEPVELNVDTPHMEFGLDSILAVEVISRLNKSHGWNLSPTDVFNHPTIRALARHVADAHDLSRVAASEPESGADVDLAPILSPTIGAEDVAVIGMACRFPGADSLEAFWTLLREGRDAVAEVAADRWDVGQWFDPDPRKPGKTMSKWAGCVPHYDHFDPAFFHISPREAELMDPQQRQLLMVAWHALEHAGYSDRDVAQKRCGIYVGAGAGDYRTRLGLRDLDASAYAFMGNSDAVLAGRVAYFLDLRGPSVAIDTACSSSLVALHLARESLCRGEIDLALAGGVTIQSTAQFHVMASKAGMLSPTGRCHTFDNGADGFVPGEGVALLVLKRLADAVADGDHIHAVIAGSAINQDGRTNGITAPSAPSQTALELEVYRRFKIDPGQIGYVEAHGTGTRLGDPIEIQALCEAFRAFTDREGFCGIGSVKSNIGHALSAAGVAGVIKTILCLEHRELVPSLYYRTPNEHIRFERGPFQVTTRNEPWPAPSNAVRHAAVSSFGFSGTNAHMVLREFPPPAVAARAARPFLPMVLSAKTETALRRKARELAAFLRRKPGLDPEDLAFTLMNGRAHLQYRLAFVAADATELAAQLERLGDAIEPARVRNEPGAEDAEERGLPAIWTEEGARPSAADARELADGFLAGASLPWADLFRGRGCRRLALPVYPFDESAYRAPEPAADLAAGRPLHPLVHRNVSTLAAQRFAAEPDTSLPFLADHQVAGRKVFPAVAYLEQARAAAALAMDAPPDVLRDVRLLRVLDIEQAPRMEVTLFPLRTGTTRFEITAHAEGEEPRLHADGLLVAGPVAPGDSRDLTALWSQASDIEPGDACYEGMRGSGLEHGPSYRVIEAVARMGTTILARLRPAPVASPGWRINPFTADGMVQTALGLFDGTGNRDTWLPVSIAETRIVGETADGRWAQVTLVSGNPATDQAITLSAALFSEQGQALLIMTGLNLQRSPSLREATVDVQAAAAAPPDGLSQQAITPNTTDLRRDLLQDLTEQVASVLKVATDHIDPGDDLSDYGLDSIGFTELGGLLADLLQIHLPPSIFFEHRTLDSFASYLLTVHAVQVHRRYARSTTPQPHVPRPAPVTRPHVPTERSRFVPSGDTRVDPIAVIGMAGRMPGSDDLEAFWRHLVQVDDLITEVPAERWDWRAIYGDPRAFNKCNVRYGGFMTGVAHFDPLFFGISPREAEAMDPQQRLFLETAWHTIEDAGYRPSALAGRKIGVFAGVANIDYNELWRARTGEITAHAATGTAHSIVPNRVSFLLDFKGPSEPVDTACSSGLVAVYRGISAIREGSCEMALAGGVNVMITPSLHIAFNKAGMLDPEGRCRTFDKDANGYVRGEGVGVVLLKPLSRALADGDHVHALIRGGAVNHAGHANSLTAPNPTSQAELLMEAYERTGVDPSQVSYVEAHGTGTRLGDPAEVSGLVKAFSALAQRSGIPLAPRSCALGSVKTNVGHLETAAGIAGLLKVILAMRHGQLPGNAHFRELNPYIDLGNSFYVLGGTEPWRPRGADGAPIPRVAGISSFGFGGANAHLVVEEFEPGDTTPVLTPAGSGDTAAKQLFVLSARSEDRLRVLAGRMHAFARSHGATTSLAHAAHTSRVGREAFDTRLALVVADWDELARRLQAYMDGTSAEFSFHGEATRGVKSLVGGEEGAGYVRSLIQSGRLDRLAALWVAGADLDWELLAPPDARRVPLPVYPFARESYWPPPSRRPADAAVGSLHPLVGQNTSTLGEHQYTTRLDPEFFLLREHRVNQQAILPAAACLEWARAAGQLASGSAVTAVRALVWMRPILVGEEAPAFHILLEPEGETVRFQIVSDGDSGRQLHVQGLLDWDETRQPAQRFSAQAVIERCPDRWDADRCYAFFEGLGLCYGPAFKVISEVAFNAEEAWSRLRLPQPDAVLQWHPVLIDGLLQTGAVLIGAHDGNTGPLLPYTVEAVRIHGPLPAECQVHATLDGAPGPAGARLNLSLYDEAGTLLARIDGLNVRPVTRAQTEIRWPAARREAAEDLAARERVAADDSALVVARRVWRPRPHLETEAVVPPSLVFDEDGGLYTLLSRSTPGGTVQRLTSGDTSGEGEALHLDPLDESQWKPLLPVIERRAIASVVIRLDPHLDEQTVLCRALALLRALGPALARRRALLCFVYDAPGDQAPPTGIDGFARTAALEYPGLRPKVIGLGSDPSLWQHAMAAELADGAFHVRLAATRTVGALERVVLPPSPPLDFTGETVLITGGAGALGRLFATDLVARGCRVILTGRHPVDPGIRAQLAELGSGAFYFPADLSSRDSVADLVHALSREVGALQGVLHAAGTTADALMARKTSEEVRCVLGAKVLAIRHLHEATRDQPLAWFAMFGSLASVTGNVGQADYAFANAYLSDFADWRERQRSLGQCHGSTLCIDWPFWRDGGMAMSARGLAFMEEQAGMTPMPSDVGLDSFHRALASGETRLALAYGRAARICRFLAIGSDPRAQDLPAAEATPAGVAAPAPHASVADGSDKDLRQALEGALLDMAAEILKIEKQHFDPEDPMDAYGFDSINLTELSSRLRATFDIELLPSVFFEYPTLRAFAGFLLKEHRDLVAARLGAARAPSPDQAHRAPRPRARPDPARGPSATPFKPTPRFRPRPAPLSPAAGGEPIAVVGMSGTMPGSATLEDFWQHLENGEDLVGEIPSCRWDWRAWYGEPSDGRTRVNRAGFMPQVDQFDAAFFGVSPKEAALMDPQHRLCLQAVWHAIEDAGQKPSDLFGEKVGVYVGVSSFDYQEVLRSSPDAVHAHELTGNAHSILANRISYFFNLRGPSEPVDTACSSSLVAIHRAVRALRAGECKAAIAGGVNVLLSPQVQLAFAKAGMLSADGRCKTFDKAADGYARGEGVGALLLKPLSAALADGNPVYGLIRGSAVNHGGRANNLVAPNPNAQAEVIAEAIKNAGIDPRTIGYVEAHGTGTSLGDPIEINGLKKAFAGLFEEAGLPAPEKPFCALGSVKTQIGHLEAAAGVAGVIRVLLCLGHGRLQGNIQLVQPSPYIRLEGSPFYLLEKSRDWARPHVGGQEAPRRAGISSFGFGGVNAHLVLEEYVGPDDARPGTAARGTPATGVPTAARQIFPLSARSEQSLRAAAGDLRSFLPSAPDPAQLAYTLQVGREGMPHRLAVTASSLDALHQGLTSYLEGKSDPSVHVGVKGATDIAALMDEEQGESFMSALFRAGKHGKLARVWAAGVDLDWAQGHADKPTRIHAPGYSFAPTSHWATAPEATQAHSRSSPIPDPPSSEPLADSDLHAASSDETGPAILDFLRRRLARVAGFDETVPTDADLAEMGLDSILAMELLRDIEAEYGLRLFPNELAEHGTLAALATYIESESRAHHGPGVEIEVPVPAAEQPTQAATPVLFLLSTPRAGSTLLRVMLMGHSRCFAPPELHLLPFPDMACRAAMLANEGKLFLGEGLVQTLRALNGGDTEAATAQVGKWERESASVFDIYAHLRSSLGGRFLVDKSPSYAASLETLRRAEELSPASRYVHLIRHPLAVADSFVQNRFHRMLGIEADPWPFALDLWDRYNANLSQFLAEVPARRVFPLHFEDLVREPEAVMRAFCEWMGIPFEQELLEPYRGDRMTGGLHDRSLPIGDPNFLEHQAIDREEASMTTQHVAKLEHLDQAARERARVLGYDLQQVPIPLAPAQQEFLSRHAVAPLCLLVHEIEWPPPGPDPARLRFAWRRLIGKHRALRHAFLRADEGWQQIPVLDPEPLFQVHGVPGTSEKERRGAVEAVKASLRDALDRGQGRLAACGLARQDDGSATLVLVLHHLVADGISLALIGRDLIAMYQDPSASHVPVDDRYERYARAQQAAKPSKAVIAAWKSAVGQPWACPLDSNGPNQFCHQASYELTVPLAQLFAGALPAEERHARLLAGLVKVLADWKQDPRILLALRRHGRSGPTVQSYQDVVGWFACDIPFAVDATGADQEHFRAVRDLLRRLPKDHDSYTRLSNRKQLPALHQVAPVRFNYQPVSITATPEGLTHGLTTLYEEPARAREYELDWIMREERGQLHCIVRYARTRHRESTVTALAQSWLDSMNGRPISGRGLRSPTIEARPTHPD